MLRERIAGARRECDRLKKEIAQSDSRAQESDKQLTVLNERLRTLQLKNGMSVPKGVDPMHPQRVSRRAMRGR